MAKNTFNLSGLLVLLSAWLLLGLGQAQAETETITYFHNDIVGTPLLATDAAGNVVWKENYQPYGGRINNTAGGDNNQWFAGKPHDRETGLAYFGARYYDPVTGRFTGMDPAGIDPENLYGLNRYSYANGNPYRYVDPDGRIAVPLIVGLALWVGAELFLPTPAPPADAPDAIYPATFPDGTAALKGIGVAVGIAGAIERQTAIRGAESTLSRSAAFREAKEKAGIPRSQQPSSVSKERLRDQDGNVEGRVYDFRRGDGSSVTIKEHSLGHEKGSHGPHFNSEVRGADGTKLPLKGDADPHTYIGP